MASSRSEEPPEGHDVRGMQQAQEGRSVSFNCSPGGAPTAAPGVAPTAAPGAAPGVALAAAPGEAAGAFGAVAAFSGSVAGKDPAHQVL